MERLKTILHKAAEPLYNARDAYKLVKGLKIFNKTNHTPDEAYRAMIRLHGQTNGKTTRWLSQYFSNQYPNAPIKDVHGVLGTLSAHDIQRISTDIQKNGFHIFDKTLPLPICDDLIDFAHKTPANIWIKGEHKKKHFDPNSPMAQVYKFDENDLIQLPDVQDLMADESIKAVAAAYIQAQPILCSVNTWFSAKKQIAQDDHGGQMYHFDMSRAKWLNFFIYLNDVDEQGGPHCYVRHSHQFKNKNAKKLLKRGYVRIPDHDIESAYGQQDIVELKAKKGSIIAVDTIGFHRGKPPVDQHRLIFEIIYASSLFGGHYQTHSLPKSLTHSFKSAIQKYPHTYQRFL